MGEVLIISTMDHTQLQPVNGRPFLLSTHVITCFKMIKLECSVRASGDQDFQRMQEIIRMHVSKYNDDPELLEELKILLRDVPTFVTDWSSSEISSDTYRLYARKTPANEATNSFVDNIRSNIQNENLREKSAIDKERIRLSHNEWANASQDTSKNLMRKSKNHSLYCYLKEVSMSLLITKKVFTVNVKWLCYMIYQNKKFYKEMANLKY